MYVVGAPEANGPDSTSLVAISAPVRAALVTAVSKYMYREKSIVPRKNKRRTGTRIANSMSPCAPSLPKFVRLIAVPEGHLPSRAF